MSGMCILGLAYFIGTCNTEYTAHLALPDLIVDVGADNRTGYGAAGGDEIQLANLLVYGHFSHQVVDKGIHLILGHS